MSAEFKYTAADLVKWLKADASCGNAWGFIIDRLLNGKHKFEVEYLIGRNFDGEYQRAYVSTGAKTQLEATNWAKDALREWAGCGVDFGDNYFPLIAREYAINGPGGGNPAKSLGTTLDFLILLSKFGSSRPNNDMLETNAVAGKDVPEVYCFVYTNKYSPSDFTRRTRAIVNIEGWPGPPGLHRMYWDSEEPWTDQSHHFAAFFCFGASHGFHEMKLHIALWRTGDWSITQQRVINQGDYDLGFVGAK